MEVASFLKKRFFYKIKETIISLLFGNHNTFLKDLPSQNRSPNHRF